MKQIQPIPTWVKGQSVTATIFNLNPIYGQLFKFTDFYYQLLDENMAIASEGNISLSGEDYQEWGNDDNYPYDWAADKLNLIITGEYVPPVLESITENVVESTTTTEEEIVIE
jgi:hypothetical protein